MGYYIQGPLFGKASFLVERYGAQVISRPRGDYGDLPKGKALIAVISNPLFEAAAYAYDADEFAELVLRPDHRHRTYLLMDLEKAKELSGFNTNEMEGARA